MSAESSIGNRQPIAFWPTFAKSTSGVGGFSWVACAALTSALGVLILSLATVASRNLLPQADSLLWLGLASIYLPCAGILVFPKLSDAERVTVVVLLGCALFLFKVIHTPTHFGYYDEFAHWRTAIDIYNSQTLFVYNPVLPVTPLYPGLEVTTVAVARLANIDLFHAGLVVLGTARVVMSCALYILFQRISGSTRVASIAVLIYMANPNYILFDAQFSYESVALPMATAFMAMLAPTNQETRGIGINAAAFLMFITVIVSHHFTSYITIFFMILWLTVSQAMRILKWERIAPAPTWMLLTCVGFTTIWLFYIANLTLDYLGYIVGSAFEGLISLTAGGSMRLPFQGASGQVAAPSLERIIALAAAGLGALVSLFGLPVIWKHHRNHSMLIAVGLSGLLYPVLLVMRLTGSGWEVSNRSSAFVFFGVGLLISLAVAYGHFPNWIRTLRAIVIVPFALVLFLGGFIIGWYRGCVCPGRSTHRRLWLNRTPKHIRCEVDK